MLDYIFIGVLKGVYPKHGIQSAKSAVTSDHTIIFTGERPYNNPFSPRFCTMGGFTIKSNATMNKKTNAETNSFEVIMVLKTALHDVMLKVAGDGSLVLRMVSAHIVARSTTGLLKRGGCI